MNAQQIRLLILANPQLRAMVEAGEDERLGEALLEVAPRIATGELFTERAIFAALGPVMADSILTKLEAFAKSSMPGSSMVARGIRWLSPAEGGVDFQHPALRALLEGLVTQGILTQEEFESLALLGTKRATIASDELREALAPWRPNGTTQPIPSEV